MLMNYVQQLQILIFMKKIISQMLALSIRLNLEAIIAEIDINHSNTKESKQSDQYESLRNMSAVELLEKFNSKIKNLQNKIYLISTNSNYNLVLLNIDIPEVGNTNVARDTIIDFDIQNIKDEDLKFFLGQKFRINYFTS